MRPRLYTLVPISCIGTLLLLAFIRGAGWISPIPRFSSSQSATGKENVVVVVDNGIDPNGWRDGRTSSFREPKVDSPTPYAVGKTKAAGSNYTRCLVIPKMKGEDVSWIDRELSDMLESGLLSTAVYGMDDKEATLRPVANKGHEVMAYLSYIIDSYESLPDVVIFMHAHQYAWHNNLILDNDAALMVRHLSPERVTREGYMNLRCHWDPGCPEWLHPGTNTANELKQEEVILASVWPKLFPGEEIPATIAQPCCAQFAVSRDRIHTIGKERFVSLRDWIINTELSDFLSGRIFEYTWQYIFTSTATQCPSMSACYCDGYGICFGGPKEFDHYFELNFHLSKYKNELQAWEAKAKAIQIAREQAAGGKLTGMEELDIPAAGQDIELRADIVRLSSNMGTLRDEAFRLGRDPKQRAIEAGRTWVIGDGF